MVQEEIIRESVYIGDIMDDELIVEDIIQRLRTDEQITDYEYSALISMATRFKRLHEFVVNGQTA